MEAKFIEVQLNHPNLQEFHSTIQLDMQKASFYSVVYLGILLQLARMKETPMARKTLNLLYNALGEIQGVTNDNNVLTDFAKYTENYSALDIKNYALREFCERYFDNGLRDFVSKNLNSKSKARFSKDILSGKEVQKNENHIFMVFAKAFDLTLCIYSYDSPNPQVIRTSKSDPQLNVNILYNQSSQNSWSLLVHFKENLFDIGQSVDLNELPFTYVPPKQPINDHSNLIIALTNIINSHVSWISEDSKVQLDEEISRLNSQNPQSRIPYLEPLIEWSNKVEKCPHDQKTLLYFHSCLKFHCRLCMQAKIDNEKIPKNNFLCSCGIAVPTKFRDKIFKFSEDQAEPKTQNNSRIYFFANQRENPTKNQSFSEDSAGNKKKGRKRPASVMRNMPVAQESIQVPSLQAMCDICKNVFPKQLTNTFECSHAACQICWANCNQICYKCNTCEICKSSLSRKPAYIYRLKYYHSECTMCQICSQSIFKQGTASVYNSRGIHLECQRGNRIS
ncbi:unnamed protein product [Blepharisma stoltei]|uniref:RING-type domain-containing protein n=1 Tax=Blepharisma stoltei TaxID=1481888 RepID=A0AAU9K5L3_9CILI|nr:unnamed protein product [Blepharisma stoltei]